MPVRRSLLRRGFLTVGAIVLTTAGAVFAYALWRYRSGYSVEQCGDGVSAGRRWNVNLDAVTDVNIDANRIIIKGQRLHDGIGQWWSESTVAEHVLPYTAAPDHAWILAENRYTQIVVRNVDDDRRICALLPEGAAKPRVASGQGPRGAIVVIAAGDWKTGPESYVAILNVP